MFFVKFSLCMMVWVSVVGGAAPVTCFALNDGRICGCGRRCDSYDMFYSE